MFRPNNAADDPVSAIFLFLRLFGRTPVIGNRPVAAMHSPVAIVRTAVPIDMMQCT